mmetsp:Transcript_25348/g.58525  ORF Transcript_25348/g.58525 Transcript_25348/m.58525 type:complete len:504 (-) Transcript_25348:383-1894(-)
MSDPFENPRVPIAVVKFEGEDSNQNSLFMDSNKSPGFNRTALMKKANKNSSSFKLLGDSRVVAEIEVRDEEDALPGHEKHGHKCTQLTVHNKDKEIDLTSRLLFKQSSRMSTFLSWSFKSGYCPILFLFLVGFIAFTMVFAAVLYLVSSEFHCASTEGKLLFLDAFVLSWTTFSTVGYGNIYPELQGNGKCWLVNMLCAIESFFGVIYVGFCGAIIFGKVVKVQSQANVVFSDPMVIRYNYSSNKIDGDKFLTPTLEFRVTNQDLFDGEIIDASMQAAVAIRSTNHLDSQPITDSSRRENQKKLIKRKSTFEAAKTKFLPSSIVQQENSITSTKIPSRNFFSLKLENASHPFFERTWILRHFLDMDSPLIDDTTKLRIAENGGRWPMSFNTDQAIASSLVYFNQIIVTFNGTSSLSASSVFAKNVYEPSHLYIGFKFADMIYKDEKTGRLHVDHRFQDDIVPETELISSSIVPQDINGALACEEDHLTVDRFSMRTIVTKNSK